MSLLEPPLLAAVHERRSGRVDLRDKGVVSAPAAFTGDPLVPQVTIIKAGEFGELRSRIDYLRSLYKLRVSRGPIRR
jgi:hypothetical protein